MNQDSQGANNSPVTLINVFEVPTEHNMKIKKIIG